MSKQIPSHCPTNAFGSEAEQHHTAFPLASALFPFTTKDFFKKYDTSFDPRLVACPRVDKKRCLLFDWYDVVPENAALRARSTRQTCPSSAPRSAWGQKEAKQLPLQQDQM
jgi:hypothetical protein